MTKYIDDKKIKAGLGADGKFHLEIECADFGTMNFVGESLEECIAQLLDKLSEALSA